MKNRVFAWINLAYRFAVHVLWRMPARALGNRADYERFRTTVMDEGYLALQPAERDDIPRVMRCFHCGLCALAPSELRNSPQDAWQEPWTFVAGAARSLERASLVAPQIPAAATSTAATAVCPAGVPINRTAAMFQRLASEES